MTAVTLYVASVSVVICKVCAVPVVAASVIHVNVGVPALPLTTAVKVTGVPWSSNLSARKVSGAIRRVKLGMDTTFVDFDKVQFGPKV